MSSTVAMSTATASSQLANDVSMAVAVKTLDAARAQGEAALSLLQAAADLQKQAVGSDPSKGRNVDLIG